MADEFALLKITGRGRNMNGKVTVYCDFEVKFGKNKIEEESKCNENKPCNQTTEEIIPKDKLLPYRDYNNLTNLSAGTTHLTIVLQFLPPFSRLYRSKRAREVVPRQAYIKREFTSRCYRCQHDIQDPIFERWKKEERLYHRNFGKSLLQNTSR